MLARKGRPQLDDDLVFVETFDRGHLRAIAGDRIGDAGPRRHAVEQQRTGAADAMFAAEMRAREIEVIAQKVRQMRARLNGSVNLTGIDGEGDRRQAEASATARRKAVT